MLPFDSLFIDETRRGTKIKTDDYLASGTHPIVDQGQSLIAGYTNLEEGVFYDVPAVIFGDHTRAIKYIDEPFFLGADGTKILKSKDSQTNEKYLYYALRAAKIPNLGYSRHFKCLKELKFKTHSRNEQGKIATILDNISKQIDLNNQKIKQLDELVKARFVEMFGDKSYDIKPFKDVCDELFAGGDVKKDRTVKVADTDHPFEVFTNGEKDDGLYGYTDYARVVKPSITISGRGTIGFCLVRTKPFYPAIRLIVATPKENLVTPSYLKYFIDSKDYSGRGASIPQLTIPMIKDEPVPVPPIDRQKEFEAFITQVDKSKFALSNELAMCNFYVRLVHDCVMHGCINL